MRPPRRRTSCAPSRPSLPMPVSTTSSSLSPNRLAASTMVRSARGRRPPIASSCVSDTPPVEASRRWLPPGAISATVGSSVSPPAASRTESLEERSRRSASDFVKPTGMCWTIIVPSPRRAGSLGSSSATARSARQSTARAPAAGENADTTTTGMVESACLSARSTPIPSRPGIARSRVSTSGRAVRHSASAESPSCAVPITSNPLFESASEMIRRISAESSVTTTRGRMRDGGWMPAAPLTLRSRGP